MSLRYIVPTLGLVAMSAAPAFAAEIGGVTLNGYVDTVLAYEDDGAVDDANIDFANFAQLEASYDIGDVVSANIELGFDNAGVVLEQAYVSYDVTEQVNLTMGRMHTFIGYEGFDAPELYRVGTSLLSDAGIYATEVEGLNVNVMVNEEVSAGLYIVDAVRDEATANRLTDDISFGGYVTYALEGVGTFDLDIAIGSAEVDTGIAPGENEDLMVVDLNAEIDALQEDHGLLFALEVLYFDYEADTGMGIMAMANYALPTEFPASATLMVSQMDPAADVDDEEQMEVAIALLTNPTGDANFGFNVELEMTMNGDAVNGGEDVMGLYIEALAIIP